MPTCPRGLGVSYRIQSCFNSSPKGFTGHPVCCRRESSISKTHSLARASETKIPAEARLLVSATQEAATVIHTYK